MLTILIRRYKQRNKKARNSLQPRRSRRNTELKRWPAAISQFGVEADGHRLRGDFKRLSFANAPVPQDFSQILNGDSAQWLQTATRLSLAVFSK